MSNNQRDIKMVVIGDTGVGKTSLMTLWIHNITDATSPTIGDNFLVKRFKTENENENRLAIWDLAGHERFISKWPMYLRGAKIALFVFDLSDPKGLKNLESKIEETKKHLDENVCFILIGNKSDCQIAIDQDAIDQCKKNYGKQFYLSVSAKSGDNLKTFDDKIIEIATAIAANKSSTKISPKKVFTHIQTLKKVCEENPNRKGVKNIKSIITMLELGSQQQNSQAYFEQSLNTLKRNLDALRWTWRSVLNTVVNVILAVFATFSIVGLPLLYCLKVWKPNEQNGVFGSFRFCTFGDKQKMQQLTEDVFAEKAVKGCQFGQW